MRQDDATYAALRKACESADQATEPIDAVVRGLAVLEADPAFNAGYGSVLTGDGSVEVDAAIIDGGSGRYGAVGAAPGLLHPAATAAAILHSDGPVLLSGQGAVDFARSVGQEQHDLKTEEQVLALRALRAGAAASPFTGRTMPPSTETVGCIVIEHGVATAGSSTGGVCGKLPGRIGDSAILGAGLWADRRAAILCSGAGEAIISLSLARRVGERLSTGENARNAVRWAVRTAAVEWGAVAAVLAVDLATLTIAAAHNGGSFPVVAHSPDKQWIVEPAPIEPDAIHESRTTSRNRPVTSRGGLSSPR